MQTQFKTLFYKSGIKSAHHSGENTLIFQRISSLSKNVSHSTQEQLMNENISIFLGLPLMLLVYQLIRLSERLKQSEAKLDALLKHFEIEWDAFSEPSELMKKLAQDPSIRIQLINAYREQTGAGLKEAKEVVDRLIDGH
jgi:ribosomal protein L7/L12